jgi:DNA-binding MurR/RpiR family transcriptional regulator
MNLILLRKIHTKIINRIEELQSLILLSLVYIFGIGATALVAKMFKRKFIPIVDIARGSWIPKKTPKTNIKMY